MATLTFNGVTLNYDPLSVDLYIKENVRSFISPIGESKTQNLGREARVLSCEGRYSIEDSKRLYASLREMVGNTISTLSCDLDTFPAVLTELVLTGDKERFGRVICYTFTEAM